MMPGTRFSLLAHGMSTRLLNVVDLASGITKEDDVSSLSGKKSHLSSPSQKAVLEIYVRKGFVLFSNYLGFG